MHLSKNPRLRGARGTHDLGHTVLGVRSVQPEASEHSGHIRRCRRSEQGRTDGFPVDLLTLDEWDSENSNREEIETPKDYQTLVGPRYNPVHLFRARAQEAMLAAVLALATRLDSLSIGLGRLGHRAQDKRSRKAPPLVHVWLLKSIGRLGPHSFTPYAALSVQIGFLWSLIRVPTMSQEQADDDQLPSADGAPKAYGYPARSLLGRVQPTPEIPEDLFSLSGPISRAYRSLTQSPFVSDLTVSVSTVHATAPFFF